MENNQLSFVLPGLALGMSLWGSAAAQAPADGPAFGGPLQAAIAARAAEILADHHQRAAGGLERDQAVFEGALSRLRPVLMTASIAALGLIPTASFRNRRWGRRGAMPPLETFLYRSSLIEEIDGERHQDEAIKLLALAFTAGLLIVAAVEDMMPEAHESVSDSAWSAVFFIAGFCLFILTSTYF